MRLAIIAAIARNRVIGRHGRLPWHIPEDLDRFKRLTTGHTVLMGRRTFESIGTPLPGRRSVVLSGRAIPGVEVYPSTASALRALAETDLVFVIGGALVFEELLPRADLLYLTRVDDSPEGDAVFPPFEDLLDGPFRLTARDAREGFSFEDYERVGEGRKAE